MVLCNSYCSFVFVFLKKHLNKLRITEAELNNHKENLQKLVDDKTNDLLKVNNELKSTNEELHRKTETINQQNSELKETLTKLKETQVQLIQSEKMASLGTLTAGVAHEINNPLNYIMSSYVGLKSYFTKYGSSEEKRTTSFLNNIYAGIKRASDIVKGLEQLNHGTIDNDELCDINITIDNCLLILENNFNENIKIIKDFSEQLILVKGNIGNLHRAFLNVLRNAFDAIEGKGAVEIKTEADENWCHIIISDDGCGIRKENISKLTDPFYTSKQAGEGTGLGLSITYSIIKEHNGQINFESKINKGTTVSVLLLKIEKK